ncbi:MAG: OB-fold nucleic acid binding domain-containing protein, partial [Gemmatimonadota bacterium]|nr:OB-fold nucleic acid binding domain-containing protein [Gemmatimonadota bacterium]
MQLPPDSTHPGIASPNPMSHLVRNLPDHADETVTITGWIAAVRVHARVAFLVLRDGTGTVQGVVVKSQVPAGVWELATSLTQEACIALTGVVRPDARAPGGHELTVSAVELVGASEEFPIQPKEHGVEFLLDHRHLWLRSRKQRAGLRVRAEVEQAIHDFFYERDFVRIDTPILTGSIGESAGTLFETDYFGERAFLAQTGQLYAECACPAFRKVYCFGPTFRAEKS